MVIGSTSITYRQFDIRTHITNYILYKYCTVPGTVRYGMVLYKKEQFSLLGIVRYGTARELFSLPENIILGMQTWLWFHSHRNTHIITCRK